MNKLILGVQMVAALLFSGMSQAQTLEEGKKLLYYDRHVSAKKIFEKLVTADPNNQEAVYWLGITLFVPDHDTDIVAARNLYQKTLMNNSNSALLLAGMGHIELVMGQVQDARNRFETAISLSQGKNAAVLNAIGYANVQAEKGDATYAVEKLRQATQLKNMKDPDVWANLGDAYKKLLQGGPAQTAYETALELNPNYARASYRIGKIYQSQGKAQEEIYMRYYNEAIAKDPTYAPVYENLYQYYYLTDVNKSAEYLDMYLKYADNDPKDCYYGAAMKYAQGLFADCITKADACIASEGQHPYANLFGLKAFAFDKLGDSVNAMKAFEEYFKKQDPAKIGPTDWLTYAKLQLKFPGNETAAGVSIEKAAALDSTEKGKLESLKVMTSYFESQKRFKEAADWYNKMVSIKKDVRKTDLYNAGYNYFRGGDYTAAINVFNIYTEKFPEDAFGYYMVGKANWAIDSTLEQGLANPAFEKAIQVGLADSVKYKNQLIGSYKYFIVYSVFKKDKATALSYCDKVLSLDANDAETINNRGIISGSSAAPRQQPKAAPAKPAGNSGSGARASKR